MKIAVLDDEKYYVDSILEEIDKHEIIDVVDNHFHGFTDPETFLESFDQYQYDLVYLDIELNVESNGIDIASKIKKRKHNCLIVFVTNYQQYLPYSFVVEPFQYLSKPIIVNLFHDDLDRAINKYKRIDKKYLFPIYEGKKFINSSEIVYVQTHYDEYGVKVTDGKIHSGYYKSSKKVTKELLESYFFKIDKSTIISFKHVDLFTIDSVTLSNGETFEIARNRRKAFKKHYFDFIEKENKE